jgi:signal transduction histidine kinase
LTLDPNHSDFHPEIQAGQYVQLSISDTGSGMPSETPRFEPFFTTR